MKYYTITAAESRIVELEADLAKYQACRVRDVDEKAWLSKRAGDLEAALREALDTGRLDSHDKFERLNKVAYASETGTKYTGPAGYKSALCELCGRQFQDHSQEDLSCPPSDRGEKRG